MCHFRLRVSVLVLLLCAIGPGMRLYAQEEQPPLQDEAVAFPAAFEVAGRYRTVADSAARAEAELVRLSDVNSLQAELEETRERLDVLRGLVATSLDEYVRPERVSRLRDRALQFEQRLGSLHERASARLQRADEIRIAWAQRRAFWRAWRDSLAAEEGGEEAGPEIARAITRIDVVIAQAASVIPEIVRMQEEADRLRIEVDEIAAQVAAVRAGRQNELTQRTEPLLFSRSYFEQTPRVDWSPRAALERSERAGFFPSNLALVFIHLLLGAVLAFVTRWLRRISLPADAWSGLLRHPWAFAVFASTALVANQYWLAPALWDVLMWAILAGSGAMLATSLLRMRSVRVVLYLLAGFYPLFLLGEALQIPPPLFRIGLAGAAFAGLVGFGIAFRRELKQVTVDRGASILLGAGVLMWAVVLVATVAGFYVLARWVLHATVTSAYIVFLVVFVMVVARGAVQTLLRVEATGRLSFLRTIGVPLVERLLRLVLLVLVAVATLNVLDIWGLAPPPLETWQQITGVGVTVAGVHITLDRVLVAAVIIYLTILISWALRAFARSEIYPRWELERGVGDSMNALLHYVLVIFALFIGLGALGVELQNFAILAGALGIGIGFGLQNIVNNFVSGLILLFERPVRVGDTVMIDEEFGTIQKIGLRSTVVLRVDQSEVIVPNADLVSEKVVNWTLTSSVARLVVPLGVAYGTSVARVLRIIREVADENPDVLAHPPPVALFTGFGDSSLDFEIRVWVAQFQMRLMVRSAILTEIDRRFAEESIEIPFPQRDLHVRSVDAELLDRLRNEGTR